MLDTIQAKREEIHAIARKHNADKLWVFGSVARKEETPESDVDFLVQFNGNATLLDHGRLYNELGAVFNRSVDVIDWGAIKVGSRFFKMVERDRVAI